MATTPHSASGPASAETAPDIDIGIAGGDRKLVAEGLSRLLADAYTLYLKTHNFHWNVTGPMFNALHVMFEGQYTEQWTALDGIAERIRALGFNAPGSYAEFTLLSSIAEEPGLGDTADHRARRTSRRGPGRRRPVRRPADTAPAGPREIRLDAAIAVAVTAFAPNRRRARPDAFTKR